MPLDHSSSIQNADGSLDQVDSPPNKTQDIIQHHRMVCRCNKPDQCVRIYRRCVVDKKVYHSLVYSRRNSTISFFVQYYQKQENSNFGKIRYFYISNNETFAVIDHYEVKNKFSEFFISTSYYELLRRFIDPFFYARYSHTSEVYCVSMSFIKTIVLFSK